MHPTFYFFSILLFTLRTLCADIPDYFKPCLNKSDAHQMRNIDFIYMINLDQRPEKFERSSEQLSFYGIYPYRFSAVNGWELPLEAINELGIKYEPWMSPDVMGTSYLIGDGGNPSHGMINNVGRTYFCHCMGRGSIGIVLSHLSILQDALDSGYETIWVMEDDIEIIKNPHLLSDLIESLDHLVGKEGWDILFTDKDTKNNKGEYVLCQSFARRPNFTPWNPSRFIKREIVSPEFRKIEARYGAYSMIIRRSGIQKILDFIKIYRIFLPYDLEYYLPDDVRLFTVMDDVVSTQIDALSDNGAPNYKDKEKQQK